MFLLWVLFLFEAFALAQGNRVMLLDEEWDTYSQTYNRHVNGWNFCKSGINDESIVQRGNLHAFLSTGNSEGSGTTIATPWLAQVADTFSFYIYGSQLNGYPAQVEFGFIPDTATITDPSDICALFIPYDTVVLSVQNQWQRTTRDMHPYYAIHGTTHRFAIRLVNNHGQELYLDEIRAWIPANSCLENTTCGKSFWVAFSPNAYRLDNGQSNSTAQLSFFATGNQSTTIHITNSETGWSQTYTHTGGTKTYIQLPTHWDNTSAAPSSMCYHVVSTQPISLFASNYYKDSWDVCNVIPEQGLGTNYIVQDLSLSDNPFAPCIVIAAPRDATTVSCVLPTQVHGSSLNVGDTLTVTLNQGQSLLLRSTSYTTFCGMPITANKPIAVFQSHSCALIGATGGRDLTLEQARPVGSWGTQFVATSTLNRTEGDIVLITSSQDNCTVTINGAVVTTLSARQTYSYTMPSSTQAAFITTSKPAYACLYMWSYNNGRTLGDPSSISLNPIDHWICEARFPIHNCNTNVYDEQYIAADHHYLSIAVPSAAADSMLLDGIPVTGFMPIGATGYSYARKPVSVGAHHLRNSQGNFFATAYGLGKWVAYGFEVGTVIDTVPEEHQACQRSNGQGRDFWATFLCNDDDPANSALSLIATGAHQASVTVTNPVTGWSHTASLTAGGKVQINLPTANTIPSGQTHNIGYHITSTAPVTLYACNYKEGSWDFAQVFPTYAIDDNYIVQNYTNNSDHPANVAFVATENGTNLSMVLPCTVTGLSLSEGSSYTVTLDAGQSLLLRANPGGDFSGMEVSSNCKPFALFQGCAAGRVGDNGTNSGRDHFFEQALSPKMWGTEFVVDASLDRSEGDRVVVTAGADNCILQINGITVATLMRGQSHEYSLISTAAAHITTSQPAYACLYLVSYRNGGTLGDPGAATLPPVNRWVCHSDFMLHQCNNNTSSQYYIANPYINIIAENSAVGTLALDGTVIPASQFLPIAGTSFSHTRMHINYGSHTLDGGDAGTFSARVYGLGQWVGFTYNIDMRVDTMERCLPQIHHDTITYSDSVCMGQSYLSPMEIVIGGTTYYPPSGLIYVRPAETAEAGILERWSNWVVDDTVHHIHLMLTVLPTYDTTLLLFLIPGDTVFFLGDTLTEACNRVYPLQTVYGCDSLVDLFLNYAEVTLSSNSQGGCPGEEVTLTAEGTHIFNWSSTPIDPELDSQQGQNPIIVHPEVTTTYHLLDASGVTIASVTVNVAPPPPLCVETNRDFIDFDHPVLTLHDCSPDRYSSRWVFSDGYTLSGERARRQFYHPLPDTITVTLHSCNQYDCCSDTTIGFHPEIRSVWFPNIFTPDEQQNNRFGAVTSCQTAEFEIFIYNRQGLLVWQSTDINIPWDGTHNSTPVPQGTYAYKWYLKDIHGDRWSGTGTVTLLR